MLAGSDRGDFVWSSDGLAPGKAFEHWQEWASSTLAPMHIDVPDRAHFAAHWSSRSVGQLRFVELRATPQTVKHEGARGRQTQEPSFQLLYCADTPIASRIGAQDFHIQAGEFVLVDNAQPYEMRMGAHRAIDVVMPVAWVKRWLPDPHRCAARPYSASAKWGAPLGSFLNAIATEGDSAALPRTVIADQLGALLALAVGHGAENHGTHKSGLIQRARQLIGERYAEPDLDPSGVAAAMGISKRYMHALLAADGTTFLDLLRQVRLDRAAELLVDARFAGRQIAEISWQCGYLDPSYFARVFRERFGTGPREWRARHAL